MKLNKTQKKIVFSSIVLLTTLTVSLATAFSNTHSQSVLTDQTPNQNQVDPAQLRVQHYLENGQGFVSHHAESTPLTDSSLRAFLGRDIAEIGNDNIISLDEAVFYASSKPATGVIIVNTDVANSSSPKVIANAYDYINLQYVHYNLKTGTITPILSAPPPGLFPSNGLSWPKLEDTNNSLVSFFPTRTIQQNVKAIFGLKDTFSKKEWFAAMNKQPSVLDLSGYSLISIAELFNPNLIWGFGIYDITTPVTSVLLTGESAYGDLEIYYKGLYRLNVDNNLLSYFPNPQFKNMPALRHIQARNNQIKAIGNFATYENGDVNATVSQAGKPDSYYLYLKSLWENTESSTYPEVAGIKKWLTETLPRISSSRTSNNQASFLKAIFSNNIYLNNSDGSVWKPSGLSYPSSSGDWGDINFSQALFILNKSLYSLDFSRNEIERLPVIKARLTNVDFSNNKLRYIPPLALQPLPWNYLAAVMGKSEKNSFANVANWNKGYNNNSDLALTTSEWNSGWTMAVTSRILAPSFSFSNNQILDWWPQQDSVNQWYAWPNTNTSASSSTPPAAKSQTSTSAQAPSPYNKNTLGQDFNGYLHRNYFTSGVLAGKTNYQSTANLLGNWNTSTGLTKESSWAEAGQNFYAQVFNNLWDNQKVAANQGFAATLNYVIGKNQPFVLPGYNANRVATVNLNTFTDNVFSKSSNSYNSMAYLSYNSLVPYIFGRTIPQSYTTKSSWDNKKINVQLLDSGGKNLLTGSNTNWSSLDMGTLFAGLESSSGTSSSGNENNFIQQVIGALPLQVTNSSSGSSNKAKGIAKTNFENKGGRLTLKISQPDINLNYEYNINVITNLDYSLSPKNPTSTSTAAAPIQDIELSNFSKKNFFATQITATDLLTELDTWAKTSDYVKLYLEQTNGLKIISQNNATREVVVGFSLRNANNEVVSLPNITIKGFQTLKSSLVDNSNNLIMNSEIEKITNVFIPATDVEVRKWIGDHFVVNWLGLELKEDLKTSNNQTLTNGPDLQATGANASLHQLGFYKLSEFKNDYITSLNFSKNNGILSFAINIPATLNNSNIPLSTSYNVSSFRTPNFTLNMKPNLFHNSADDYANNPILLRPYIEFTPQRHLANGTVQTVAGTSWGTLTDKELVQQNLIPQNTKLAFEDFESQPEGGILSFNLKLYDLDTDPQNLVSIQNFAISNLSTFLSKFDYSAQADQKSGITYITDPTKSNQTPETLVSNLKSMGTNQKNFTTWIQPLINFSQAAPVWSNPTDHTPPKITGTTKLTAEQIAKLLFGFGPNVGFNSGLIETNLVANNQSQTLGINNLYVKGGYKNGTFYPGSEANAPVIAFKNLLVSFFGQTTLIPAAFSKTNATSSDTQDWEKQKYVGYKKYYKKGMENWQNLLPSEWRNQLINLKVNNTSNLVNATTYDVNNFATIFAFLNHILNTSTSNLQFQTRVDILNPNAIIVNDFTGKVIIPANTLMLYNKYENPSKATPTETAVPYSEAIEFSLANYKSKLSEAQKSRLPWASIQHVNLVFAAVEINALKTQLTTLMDQANAFYNATAATSAEIRSTGQRAITILANNFIDNAYYSQAIARNFFTNQFTSENSAPNKMGQFTRFSSISFANENQLSGKLDVTVNLSNYIDSYNPVNNKYQLVDKSQTFNLTQLLRRFVSPVWNSATIQTNNLSQRAPEFNFPLQENGADTFSYANVSKDEFKTMRVTDYYNNVIAKHLLPSNNDYVVLDGAGLNLISWKVVNNFGVPETDDTYLKSFETQLANIKIIVKKSDIFSDPTCACIYVLNPQVHWNNSAATEAEKNDALSNIFNQNQNLDGTQPIDANNNFSVNSLPNITLTGFLKTPTSISLKTAFSTIALSDMQANKTDWLPSEIYSWVAKNFKNASLIDRFLRSFFIVDSSSDFDQPLQLSLSAEATAFFEDPNSPTKSNPFITFNDGDGTFNFLKAIYVVNSFASEQQRTPNSTPLLISEFISPTWNNNLELRGLKTTSTSNLTLNGNPNNILYSNILSAENELKKNNYALAKKLLIYEGIKTNKINAESELNIHGISSNLIEGTISINYTLVNKYNHGKRFNASGTFVLTDFYSGLKIFLKYVLAPTAIVIISLIIIFIYTHKHYRQKTNITKFLDKFLKKGGK